MKTTRFSQTLFLPWANLENWQKLYLNNPREPEETLQCIQHLSDGKNISGERVTHKFSSEHPFSPSSGYPLYFHLLSFLSLFSNLPFPMSSLLPCLKSFSPPLTSYHFLPPSPSFLSPPPQSWLFCSHSEHVQHPALETGIKGTRMRLESQAEGCGPGTCVVGEVGGT